MNPPEKKRISLDAEEKKQFITDLCNHVRDCLLADVPKMPKVWDGIELRNLTADRFQEQAQRGTDQASKARFRKYRQDVLDRNL